MEKQAGQIVNGFVAIFYKQFSILSKAQKIVFVARV